MKLTLLMFGPMRDLFGQECVAHELPDGGDIAQLAESIALHHPRIQPALASLRFAVHETFVDAAYVLNDGDEVALIPPVSGG